MKPEQSYEALYLELRPQIERVARGFARKNYMSAEDADDFVQIVHVKFIEDDYARLRMWKRQSTLTTFVVSVVANAYKDYRNHLWGKWRTSEEAKRLGPIAVLLERYVAREGYTLSEAIEILRINHQVMETVEALDALAATLPYRTKRQTVGEGALADAASDDSAEDELVRQERRARSEQLWAHLRARLDSLPSQDAAIIALRFKQGRTIADVAKILGLEQKALYRRVASLLKSLRSGLIQDGFGPADLDGFLGPEDDDE